MIEFSPPSSQCDLYGEDFVAAVQNMQHPEGGFVDGMDFVRRMPLLPDEEIRRRADALDLHDPRAVDRFLSENFAPRITLESKYSPAERDIDDHIDHLLTDALICHYPDAKPPYIAVKNEFPAADLVRFQDIDFGWDDDEVVDGWIGLADYELSLDVVDQPKVARLMQLIEGVLDNKAHLIDTLGFVPNGNIACLATRAQPPMFADMIEMYTKFRERHGLELYDENSPMIKYIPQMHRELLWWQRGMQDLERNPAMVASECVVLVRDEDNKPLGYMFRYWDSKDTPRDESYREDVEMATMALKYDPSADVRALFRNIRGAAAEGWDFCYSRQNKIPEQPWTNVTTELIPPDLNALMVKNMRVLAQGYALKSRLTNVSADEREVLKHRVQTLQAEADRLVSLIDRINYNPATQLFHDYNFTTGKHVPAQTLAAYFPLYTGALYDKRVDGLVEREVDFQLPGGWATSLHNGLEGQWDGDIEWILLERKMQKGLERAGYTDLARRGRGRAIYCRSKVYAETRKIPEKVNGRTQKAVQKGEYTLHGDLGMSVGGLAAMRSEARIEHRKAAKKQGGNRIGLVLSAAALMLSPLATGE